MWPTQPARPSGVDPTVASHGKIGHGKPAADRVETAAVSSYMGT
jgi:hypothetical protein